MTDAGSPPPPWVAPNSSPAVPPPESSIPPGWSSADDAEPLTVPTPSAAGEVYGYQPPPTYANPLAAHKPGIIPLRPLNLGDVLGGALSAITTNIRAVAAISAIVAVLGGAMMLVESWLMGRIADGAAGAVGGVLTLSVAAAVVLTGALSAALAYPTSRAIEGRYPPLSRCWQRLRPRLPAALTVAAIEFFLVALPLTLVTVTYIAAGTASSPALAVVGIVLTILVWAALAVLATYLAFALPVTVLEGLAPFDALRRSVTLVQPVFGRVVGILLLVVLIVGIAQSVITSPAGLASDLYEELFDAAAPATLTAFADAVFGALAQFITLPFLATAITVLYTDTRIRLEGFDITLIAAARTTSQGTA